MANPRVVVDFVADTTGLQKGLRSAGDETKTTGSRLQSMGRTALNVASVAGVGALVGILHTGVAELTEASKVAAQTNAVLKSTGGVANVTAGHVNDLAGALMRKTGIDDEAIQSGENLLLTFTRVRNGVGKNNQIFDQATKIMADMSTALGQDMKTSAIQLGKALNDPVKGITALTRVGVTFTKAQKDQIKAATEAGDTMGAQKIILAELTKEFGGSAEAAGKTLPGQLNILKQSFSNLSGQIVSVLAPVLSKIVGLFQKYPGLLKLVVYGVLVLVPAIWALNAALAVMNALSLPVTATFWIIAGAIAAVIAATILVIKYWDQITAAFGAALDWLQGHWKLLLAILTGPFGLAVDAIITYWDQITGAVQAGYDAVVRIFSGLKGAVVGAIGALGQAVWDVINNIGAFIVARAGTILGWGAAVAGKIKSGVLDALYGIGAAAWDVINNVGEFIANAAAAILGWGTSIASRIRSGLITALSGIGAAAWDLINNIGDWVANAADAIAGWGRAVGTHIKAGITAALAGVRDLVLAPFADAASWLVDAGRQIVQGLINGIGSMAGALASKVKSLVTSIPSGILHHLGIHSPSRVMRDLGRQTMEGYRLGLASVQPQLMATLSASMNAVVGSPPAAIPAAAPGLQVHVYIGDQELRDLVRVEVRTEDDQTARALLGGRV